MAALSQHKTIKSWGNERELVRVTYDYSVDGGAVGALNVFTADEACVVKLAEMHVKTLCTSGGLATVSVGKTGDLAGMVAATAVASLVADAVILGASLDASHVLAAGDIVKMDIAVDTLTAGKIELVFEVLKF